MDLLERRSVLALALIYLFRMLGLFLILPVIGVAADGLTGADAALIGTAIGIYGLTQASLQIPMGMWSDKIGRKRVIVIGLLHWLAFLVFSTFLLFYHCLASF